jgi:uncharacterized protein YpmS
VKKICLAALFAVFITGCAGGFIKSQVQSGIRDALPTYIGPAKSYTVSVDGSATEMLNGHIRHLHIDGTDVKIDPKLTINALAIDMDDVHYNSKRQLTRVGSTLFKTTVTEPEVNQYAEQGLGRDYKPKVTLSDGQIRVNCVANILGVGVPVAVTGKPEVVHGTRVNFVADSLSAAHLPIPAAIANKILERINPILDMSTMKFPITIRTITVRPGFLDLSGEAVIKN